MCAIAATEFVTPLIKGPKRVQFASRAAVQRLRVVTGFIEGSGSAMP